MASKPPLLCCLLYACAITPIVHAGDLTPPAEYEGKTVAHVRFDPPAQPLAAADLTRALAFSPGVPLHLADVRAAIKRLYGTGEYSNIEVDAEPAPGGVDLIFRTTSQWFVGAVDVKGKIHPPPNAGQLSSAARLDLGAPFSDGEVDTAVDNLRTLLQHNGLYRGTITPQVARDPQHQQVSITFQVDSGKRARLTLPNVVGDTKIPAAKVAHAAKYKEILFFPWKLATEANTESGLENIRNKYEKQDRLTASVTLDRTDYLSTANRVRPTIQAVGGPKVKIDAEGAKVSKSTLKRYVPVFDEGTVDQDLLVTGARNLRDYFQNRGYFDVQVGLASHNASPDLETITYKVSLGATHRVVSLTVKGNRYFTTAEIRQRMFLQPKGFIRLRHGRYSQTFATRDGEAIQALYRDGGFRDCQVATSTSDNYRGKQGDVAITVNIQEGPQYLVSNLAINGITLRNKDAIVSSLASVQGQPYSETAVAVDRDYILAQCQSAGYPDATFEFHSTPAGPHQFNVQYDVTQGRPQYVRDVLISGLHTSRYRLVDPLISLHSGDPLSWTEMGEIQRRLYNLGVFDTVDTAIQNPDGDFEQKYVDIHLVEAHLYSMAVGVGAEIAKIGGSATSISNPTGVTGFAPRFDLQLTRLNMWGLGQSVAFNGRYSTIDRRAALSYTIPKFHNVEGRNITVTGLYDNTRDILTFTAVRLQGAVQVSQRLSKATKLLYRYSWTNDHIDQSTLKIDPLLIPLYSQPSQVGLFGVNLVQDRRDNPEDAHRGIYNSLDIGLASHVFGGNKNFARFLGRNSYYKKLGGNLILASNTEFGVIRPFSTDGIATSEYIPLPERFFGGGETTMRGFPMNQAGPRDPDTGFPLGGNALLFHTTELRFPLIGNDISGVIFHDMGNIYTGLGSISFSVHQNGLTDFNYMVHAVGFGIRYRTPVGPILIDLAYSINPPTFNGLQGTYDQLLFGGATKTVQSVSHFQYFFSIGQAF
jgi:outer membrane protein assembly complex protein YaeT